MANRNSIIQIPLNGALRMNKSKADITQFTGYNKINCPIYGGCLSPLYAKNKSYADLWDRSGNYYNIDNGTLTKNGTAVLSFANTGFKKEVSDITADSFDVYSNNIYTIKETATAGTFLISDGISSKTVTVFSAGTTLKTKAKRTANGKVIFCVVYSGTSGPEYWFYDWNNEEAKTGVIDLDIKAAGIQIADLNSTYIMITVYSNYGANQTDVKKVNLVYNASTQTVYTDIEFNCVSSSMSVTTFEKYTFQINMTATFPGWGVSMARHYKFTCSQPAPVNIVVYGYNGSTKTQVGIIPQGYTSGEFQNVPDVTDLCWFVAEYTLESPQSDGSSKNINYSYTPNTTWIEYKGTGPVVDQQYTGSTMTAYKKTVRTSTFIGTVSAIMDNGKLYSVEKPNTNNDNKITNGGVIIFSGAVSAVTLSNNKITIGYNVEKYTVLSYIEGSYGPAVYTDYNITFGQEYIRSVYSFKSSSGNKAYNFIYDSAVDEVTVGGGVNSDGYNTLGSVSDKNNWRLLFNNGLLSNISYYDNDGQIGTLIEDWNTVDDSYDIVRLSNTVYYKTADGVIRKVSVTVNTDWEYQFIENRYIVINTTSYYNCYDIQKGEKLHWASDFNNRVSLGKVVSGTYYNTDTAVYSVLVAASQNNRYETTGRSIASVQYGAVVLNNVLLDNEQFICADSPENDNNSSVDLYLADNTETTVALYKISYLRKIYYVDPLLQDLYFATNSNGNMFYNPNIFSKFVSTYNNKDMVINNNMAYSLIYSGVTPVFLFAMLGGLENIDNIFVIQTSYYAVSGNKIISMSYSDGVVSLNDVAANINGMQYIGCLPTFAIFYSPMNRCFYSFAGDAILTKMIEANDISAIEGTWYNTATQALYIATDNGLYIMDSNFTYRLEYDHVSEVYFTEDGHAIINTADSSIFIAYNNEDGYTPVNIDLETKYYGLGDNTPINIDCWYIRLFNNNEKTAGTVTVKASTITDKGTRGIQKSVAIIPSDWDKETDSYYIRFQPQLQRGMGVSLSIESPFPIQDILLGYSSLMGEAQIAHRNI